MSASRFAGLYLPREVIPNVLRRISDWTPSGAAVQALQTAAEGGFPPARPLLVLVGYTLLSGIIAAKRFKWE